VQAGRRVAMSLLLWGLSAALGPAAVFSSGIAEGGANAIVDTGHKGSVLSMEYDGAGGRLFTTGEDGTVRIWDLADRRLTRIVRVGHHGASMIAISPTAAEFAVLETDGISLFDISAWNWNTGEMLFRVPLDEQPLFLRYSGAGSYLVFGVPYWQGLRIIDAAAGTPVPFHPEGFGIVSFAEISKTEKTVMTYQPNGRIAYWDLASGSLIKEARSVALLSHMRTSRDRRYLLGTTGKEVLLIDLLSGAVKSRTELSGVISEDISAKGDEIACLTGGDAPASLTFWRIASDRLVPGDRAAPGPAAEPQGTAGAVPGAPASLSLVRYAGDELFAAGAKGELSVIPPAGGPSLVAKDELADAAGIAVGGSMLAVSSDQWIWLFSSDGQGSLEALKPNVLANPLRSASGLAFLDDGRLLVWSKTGDAGAYGLLDPRTGSFTPGFSGFASPLTQALPKGNRLATLEKGGMVRLIDLSSATLRFSVWAPGTNRIVMVSPSRLVGARSSAGGEEGSLLSIDTDTGETVVIPSASIFTYELSFDPARRILYSIGVDKDGRTDLFANSGKDFEKQTILSSYPEDDLSATIAVDSGRGVLYSSLGYDRIVTWDGSSLGKFPPVDAVPRRLVTQGGLLYALNDDSTVGLWDPTSQKLLGEIYLFASKEWCLIMPGGKFAASDGAAALVSVLENGVAVENTTLYRVSLSSGGSAPR
jgi:WD40 repeat protein